MTVWQVRYATGAIRNISVEEVGKRIVKAIPNVLQQLNSLSSSQDQVIFAAALAAFVALAFVPRASLVDPPSLPRRPRPVTLQQPSRACRKLRATYTFYNRHDGVFHINSTAHSTTVRYLKGLIACVPRRLRFQRAQTLWSLVPQGQEGMKGRLDTANTNK